MRPKRKRGKSVAKEGWTIREQGLCDFLSPSGVSLSQQNTIEWSSSDDEGQSCSESKACIAGVQKLVPSAKKLQCAYPQEISDSFLKKKLKVVKKSDLPSHTGCKPTPKRPLVTASTSLNKSDEYGKKKACSLSTADESTKASFEHGIDICLDPLITPSKDESNVNRSKDLQLSPVLGSQRTPVVLEKQLSRKYQVDRSPVLGSQWTQTVTEKRLERRLKRNLSPIIGSQRTHSICERQLNQRSRGVYKGPEHSVHGPSASTVVSNEPSSPVLGSSERPLKRRIKKFHLKSTNSLALYAQHVTSPALELGSKFELYENAAPKKEEESIGVSEDEIKVRLKGRYVCQSFSQDFSVISDASKNVECPAPASVLECGVDIVKKKEMYLSSEEDNENGCIDSQSSDDDVEAHPDTEMDKIDSSFKETQPEDAKLSEESGDVSMSVGSVISPEEDALDATAALKKGSDWLRTLQHRTPEKPDSSPCTDINVESAKKKIRKDGHAGRLRRLIKSWQSSVQMWAHQISVGSPEIRSPKMEESAVKIFSPGSVMDKIKKEIHYDNKNKGLFSPGVKNLQNFLIDSPQNTPGVSEKKMDTVNTKNYLLIRILKIDKYLPSNSALCEVLYDSSKETVKQEDFELKQANPVKYLIFFNFLEQKDPTSLRVKDRIKVYSPWQLLDLPAHTIPVLFTSYFSVNEERTVKEESQDLTQALECKAEKHIGKKILQKTMKCSKKKIILTSWSCKCMSDSSVLPSMCDARQCMKENELCRRYCKDLKSQRPSFRVIKEASQELQQMEVQPAWTVLEAIEKCGGVSDVQVTISVRAHRVISHSNSKGEIEHWEVVGQDASGIFCSLKIPNRPLVRQLTKVIEEGEGKTWTLTHVNVVQRLTNTQNPGLFTLISSLHHAYQKNVKEDPLLYPILVDHVSSSSQTYCYVFSVNLGVTEVLNCNQEVVIPLSLPHFSLKEVTQVQSDGQRGSVCFYVLYKIDNLLYGMSQPRESSSKKSSQQKLSVDKWEQVGSFSKNLNEKNAVFNILVGSKATLPRWIPDNGTVMTNVFIKDIVIWHGSATIDEYSSIRPQKSEFDITLSTLLKILQPLSPSSNCHDLTVVSGTIQKVDEESAYTWLACSVCGSLDVEESETGGDCSACGQATTLDTQYFMEVWIDCGAALQHCDIKVKLYQTMIKKLLTSCHEAEQEGYDAGSLVGRHLRLMVCVLEDVKKSKLTNFHSYRLLQLPY